MSDTFSTSPIEPTDSSRIQKQEQADARKLAISQEASSISMTEFADEAAFNPVTMTRRFEPLESKVRKKAVEKQEEEQMVPEVEAIQSISEEYEERNPELQAKTLQLLLSQIKGKDSAEEILRKTMQFFPDHSLADEAFEYLERVYKGEALAKIREAKTNLNETYGREVRAGRNIGEQAREFSRQGLGSPTGLRDLYRDITGNPRSASTLFQEMNEKFTFDKMQKAIDFFLHSLGADLKSKGPSIAPGELHNLMTEARNLLAILGVYRFFKGRMDLVEASFQRAGMLMPPRMTFELLARLFVQFLLERYPSMDKAFQLMQKMGLSSDVMAQIIVLTQMRDAVRGVAPKLYRTDQHRHDVLMSYIEALEELEEQLEGDEEQEEEEK
ncbi:MAG: type III secretion system gatekeeper subunit SctW [Verrucomicrobia bacterium]|nr:type III secretion system gatekeeper subunit SctW [Verrucomicrobiota bacterium]